jgi:hypothetical protein
MILKVSVKIVTKLFFLILLVFILFSSSVSAQQLQAFSPTWLKQGTFAEYSFMSIGVQFTNNSIMRVEDGTVAFFRWECIELDGTIATINVSLEYVQEISNISFSTEVKVDSISRDVFLLNGTLIGTTRLWAPSTPTDGQELVIWNSVSDQIMGTITYGSLSDTPQGYQKGYFLEGSGTINGYSIVFSSLHDVDTGLMIDCFLSYDAMLIALNIKDPQRDGVLTFVDTNIDLGPKDIWPEIAVLLPGIILVIVVVIISISFYLFRKKKKP